MFVYPSASGERPAADRHSSRLRPSRAALRDDESGDDSVCLRSNPPRSSTDDRVGPVRRLTPEEDAIGEPDDEEEDDIDPTLPADLWFRAAGSRARRVMRG